VVGKIVSTLHVDASHFIYQSGHGHGGLLFNLGFQLVFSRRFKLQSIARSSYESKLVALDDSITYAIWYTDLLTDLGFLPSDPIVAYLC